MKKCVNCGRFEESNNATMCSVCGAPLAQVAENAAPVMGAAPTPAPAPKKNNSGIIIAIIVAAIILVVGIIVGALIFSGGQDSEPVNNDDDVVSTQTDDETEEEEEVANEEDEEKDKVSNNISKKEEKEEEKEKEENKTPSKKPSSSVKDEEANDFTTEQLTVKLGEKFNVGDAMEITFDSAEWVEDIKPSKTTSAYSYFKDKEGEKYFVIKGTAKNLTTQDLDIAYVQKSDLYINDSYKFSGTMDSENSDGTGFYDKIKPLQTLNIIVYASVSDDAYDICESTKFKMCLWNDAAEMKESESSFFYRDRNSHGIYVLELENE